MKFAYPLVAFCCFGVSLGWALDRAVPPAGFKAPPLPGAVAVDDVADPSDRREAEAFLSRVLPLATAANPKYRSGASPDLTTWLIKRVRFSAGATPQGIVAAMDEEAIVFRDGVRAAVNTHEVVFAIGDVDITQYSYPSDVTERGEKAVGVMFQCRSGKCVRAKWNGSESVKAEADLYLYDPALRRRILRAFAILERAARR